MPLKEIIWPAREKLLGSLLISAAFIALLFGVSPAYRAMLYSIGTLGQALGIAASLLIGTLIYYPLSCGVLFLYSRFSGEKKRKGKARRELAFAIILIAVFNPLTFSSVYAASDYIDKAFLSYPCGLELMGFTEVSPAEDAGMIPGEVILAVDNRTVDTTGSLAAILRDKLPRQAVLVRTDRKEYTFELAPDPETGKAIMGVILLDKYCRK